MQTEKQLSTTGQEMPQDLEEQKDLKFDQDAILQQFDANDKKLVKQKLKEPFSYEKLFHLMQTVQNPEFKIPVLIELLFEWTRMFKSMGKFMSAAFSDISSKAVVIGKDYQQFYQKEKYITDVIKIQKEAGITRLNGQNSKKQGFKDKKSTYYKYVSVSRTIVRISWLFSFITNLMENLLNDADKKLSKCAKEAYAVALAPHHPSIVRTGASIALSAAPKRSKFMKLFLGNTYGIYNNTCIYIGSEQSEQFGKQCLEKTKSLIKPLDTDLKELVTKFDLQTLP